jgi:CubicO group peptidase (beta-lactamase class C family)
MAQVHGECVEEYQELLSLLQTFIESGEELGASITVNIDGISVVDIWGGYKDDSRIEPWEEDTIVNVWSTTKTVIALAALILVDRGLLDVNEKVSKYWPEFAANGKQDIEVRHVLSHTSGVAGWDDPMTIEDVYDGEKSTAKLAKQAPWWVPGTASGYHFITMGNLVGELVLRITGKTLTQFVAEEIAVPLGADFQIGAEEQDFSRISPIVPFPPPPEAPHLKPNSVAAKAILNPLLEPRFANSAAWKRAELGGDNGHGNARSVTCMLSTIALGGQANGVQLLSPKTISLIFQEQARGVDLALGWPIRWGIGFGLPGDGDTFVDSWMPKGRVCYWGGWGGSIVIMDLERKLTMSYMMNNMDNVGAGNNRCQAYVKAVYNALGA